MHLRNDTSNVIRDTVSFSYATTACTVLLWFIIFYTHTHTHTHKCTIRVYLYPFAKYTIFLTLSGLGYFISSRSTPRALCHEPSANIFFTFLSPFLLFLRYEGIFSTPFSYGFASARRRKTREDCGGGVTKGRMGGAEERTCFISASTIAKAC